jgi:hypothetical protein
MFRPIARLVMAVVGLVALCAYAGSLVPFAARGVGQIIGTAEISPSEEYPFGATALMAVDRAYGTHLGKFTTVYNAVAGMKQVTVEGVPVLMFVLAGTADITAANGDQQFWTFSIVSPEPPPPLFDFEGELQLVGGTGRFKGATGSSTTVGQLDFVTGAFHYVSNGHISSVGSNKKK